MSVRQDWIPVGPRKDLNIERDPSPVGGGFINAGGWKIVWHITVSPWLTVDSMVRVLKQKRAEPHLVIGGRPGFKFPVVVQLLPFSAFGRALAHPAGTPETNRARCIQVEICANPGNVHEQGKKFQDQVGAWDEVTYKALANLSHMIHWRVPDIPVTMPRPFAKPVRYTPNGFVRAKGHVGHCHVPHNDHFDPTRDFKGSHLIKLIKNMPEKGYQL